MQFKNPEILYFLFALVLPILVHLFQLRRFKTHYFTNVRFLKTVSIASRKSATLKKWLLLACRLLLVTTLVIAFAQPYFVAKDAKNASNELYIILDNSFSMQAKGKHGPLLKRAVQELLENIPENTRFSLLTNTDTYWDTSIGSIKSSLQNLNYSALAFDLERQLTKIKLHKTPHNKDIVIITDALGLQNNALQNSNPEDALYFIIPEPEQKNNSAIDSVYIHKEVDRFYEINVSLSNYGTNTDPLAVAIYNQNQLLAKRQVRLDSNPKTVTFSIPKAAFHGYVSIQDSGLTYDNTYYFTISEPKKNNIIALGDPAKSNFLKRIYTPEEFVFQAIPLAALDYNLLQAQDVLILNELEDLPQALQTTLVSFVTKGGTLIFIPSDKSSVATNNLFLKNFGNLQFLKKETTEKKVTQIHFNHPLFKDVFQSKVKNFQYPSLKSSFVLSAAGTTALSNNDQSSFLTTITQKTAKVYVFAGALNPQNSNFQQSPLIVPTFYKMGISNSNQALKAFTVGATNQYTVTTTSAKDAVLTVKNKNEQSIPIQQIGSNKVQLFFTEYPQQAGNFDVLKQNKKIDALSFNYARSESDLSPNNANPLRDYKTSSTIEAIYDRLQSDRTDTQIWKWFVIFALLLLLCETAIIRFLK
ncbi:BatA domain-containing protein [Flavobacterium crassostreae]|uniref:Aerotolerance regulator N-terminal domain-containing protein n=1 Tax=Flavobacterium crassostreae TaxID=1763534 RepID=A0A1B9E2F3_9FLAO|nr:BatA domain-containing protein [Flavobacterium crassostreae]OCB76106.1 hypothetical protein LPBF_07285 [Flavobacterium crassostreae]